ncbi:unnamed protein product [Paramecium sonneborni]|uniref:Uncharacterized protein n=1 Tax=Paramecium sonneborni TaxID=65129 RepID=A0A8S1KAF6_9CILI|nr:unnamed protein product [Paramecium sonneborni]
MRQQEIESTFCQENKFKNKKNENSLNRITIEQIPNKDLTNCNCQLSRDLKSKKCQRISKCKYQLPNELNQIPEITLFQSFNEISNGDPSIEAFAYKKLIKCIRDYNQIKDQNEEFRLKLKIINKSQDLLIQDQYYETLNENYPKIAAELQQSQYNYKNDHQMKILIFLQDQLDQILDGDETFFFFFLNQGIDFSIQKSIQFLQRANQREIESHYQQSQGSTSIFKIKSDSYKISLISIQKNKLDFEPLKKDNLQFLTFYFNEQNFETQKNLNTSNVSYNIPVDNSLESIRVALKFFAKEKLKEFQPNVIIFFFEISNNKIKDPQVFYELIKSFHKISQGKLIIIPKIDPQIFSNRNDAIQQYINCTNYCFLGCLKNLQTHKLDQNSIIKYYEKLYPYFVEKNMAQRKEFYIRELKTLQIQRPIVNLKQSKQTLSREFPLIDKDGTVVLLDIEQDFDINQNQYFVEYNQNQNQEYDGFIILIESNRIQVIYFGEKKIVQTQNSQNLNNQKYQIVNRKQFTLPQNLNGVYFFDTEQNILIYFFGFSENQEFNSDIQFLEIQNYQPIWEIVKFQNCNKKKEDGFYQDFQQIIKIISARQQFSVTKNKIDGFSCQEKNSYVCIGGIYNDEKYNYGCIIQEIVIAFKQKVYSTKIVEKSKIDKFFKECPNPLLIRMNDAFVLYFEKNGNFNINNINPSITKLCFWKSRQHLIQTIKINFKDTQSQHSFLQLHQQFSSHQQNIRLCQINQQVENIFNFRILIEDKTIQKQPNFSEKKFILRKFSVITISIFSLKNEIIIDCKQFQVNFHPLLKTIQDYQAEEKQELFQNLVENLKNTFIFHYNEYDHQYILCYVDQTKKVEFKRFVFYDSKTQENDDFRDYQEIVYYDWAFSKLYITRKQITFTECNLIIYECYNINFQDVKDSSDDILHQVPIQQIYKIQDFKTSYQLIGFHVEIKENESFEGIILTNKNQYQIINQKKKINHTQKKHNQPLNLNPQQKFVFLKYKQSYYLFYKRLQFQQASVNKVSQNIIEIKYLFLDSNFQFITGNTLLYPLDEPLSILGSQDGTINKIKSQENLIEIQILINQNHVIFKTQIFCQINQETNQLDQLNLSSQITSKHEGFTMFPLIQSNKKQGDYIVKQSRDHSEFCSE